jgi:hypothetical protein
MKIVQGRPKRAATVAVATPCWPAPVSAMIACLAHPAGEQDLADAVVDLVRAGVVQLLALQIDLGAAQMLGQPLGIIKRARPADIILHQVVELGCERRDRPWPRDIRARGRGSAASASRRHSGRRTGRTARGRQDPSAGNLRCS